MMKLWGSRRGEIERKSQTLWVHLPHFVATYCLFCCDLLACEASKEPSAAHEAALGEDTS